MFKLCTRNDEKVKQKTLHGNIDHIALSCTNLIDDIILKMNDDGILNCLNKEIHDKRRNNKTIPFSLILTLAIAAKMKIKSSVSDIPYAIQDYKTLASLGFNMVNVDFKNGLMVEGTLRNLLNKYTSQEFIDYYNNVVQKQIMPKAKIEPNIHILDCTKIPVNLLNDRYENSTLIRTEEGLIRGYKLSTLRGLVEETGIIEEIRFGTISTHDLNLSENMLKDTKCLKEGDVLICDRGFISREIINFLKNDRKVDVYIPLRKNMDIYNHSVEIAKMERKWNKHHNKKRPNQYITQVNNIGSMWRSNDKNEDVDLNSCVVYDLDKKNYSVFITTDLNKTGKQIVQMYELRPEIEEDYRQIKDFWNLSNFQSTKYNMITFHIICVLLGYLFFKLYILTEEGEQYLGKSLPVVAKKYENRFNQYYVIYADAYFGIVSIKELLELYASCTFEVQKLIVGMI